MSLETLSLPPAFFWTPGPVEILVILLVALLLFGRRLPEIARSLGRSLVEFKAGMHDLQNQVSNSTDATPSPRDEEETEASASERRDDATS